MKNLLLIFIAFLFVPTFVFVGCNDNSFRSPEDHCAESCRGGFEYTRVDGCNRTSKCLCLGDKRDAGAKP